MKINIPVLLIFCLFGIAICAFPQSSKNQTPIKKAVFAEITYNNHLAAYTDAFKYVCKNGNGYPICRVTELKGIEDEH